MSVTSTQYKYAHSGIAFDEYGRRSAEIMQKHGVKHSRSDIDSWYLCREDGEALSPEEIEVVQSELTALGKELLPVMTVSDAFMFHSKERLHTTLTPRHYFNAPTKFAVVETTPTHGPGSGIAPLIRERGGVSGLSSREMKEAALQVCIGVFTDRFLEGSLDVDELSVLNSTNGSRFRRLMSAMGINANGPSPIRIDGKPTTHAERERVAAIRMDCQMTAVALGVEIISKTIKKKIDEGVEAAAILEEVTREYNDMLKRLGLSEEGPVPTDQTLGIFDMVDYTVKKETFNFVSGQMKERPQVTPKHAPRSVSVTTASVDSDGTWNFVSDPGMAPLQRKD